MYSLCMAAKQGPFQWQQHAYVNYGPLINIQINSCLFSYVRKSLTAAIIVRCLAFSNPKESSWYNLSKKICLHDCVRLQYAFVWIYYSIYVDRLAEKIIRMCLACLKNYWLHFWSISHPLVIKSRYFMTVNKPWDQINEDVSSF